MEYVSSARELGEYVKRKQSSVRDRLELFRAVCEGVEYGHVSKEWAGMGKELFTSADNYMLEINENVPPDHPMRQLIVAAVLCIDMVLKE